MSVSCGQLQTLQKANPRIQSYPNIETCHVWADSNIQVEINMACLLPTDTFNSYKELTEGFRVNQTSRHAMFGPLPALSL